MDAVPVMRISPTGRTAKSAKMALHLGFCGSAGPDSPIPTACVRCAHRMSGPGHGPNRSSRHRASTRVYANRSCRRLSRCCQNSMTCGDSR